MIYINDTLRIGKVDDNCLQLEGYKEVVSKKTGNTTKKWCWLGYYGDLRSALCGALKKKLFDTADEELQLKDLVAKIDTAIDDIKNFSVKMD